MAINHRVTFNCYRNFTSITNDKSSKLLSKNSKVCLTDKIYGHWKEIYEKQFSKKEDCGYLWSICVVSINFIKLWKTVLDAYDKF